MCYSDKGGVWTEMISNASLENFNYDLQLGLDKLYVLAEIARLARLCRLTPTLNSTKFLFC